MYQVTQVYPVTQVKQAGRAHEDNRDELVQLVALDLRVTKVLLDLRDNVVMVDERDILEN